MAEEYCATKSEGLLTTLFELYVGFYEDSKKKVINFLNYLYLYRDKFYKKRHKINLQKARMKMKRKI